LVLRSVFFFFFFDGKIDILFCEITVCLVIQTYSMLLPTSMKALMPDVHLRHTHYYYPETLGIQ